MNPELIVAGFIVGALVGLTGVGGGSIMTPLLIYIGLDPLVAVGTDLAYNLPTKLFGWFLHQRQNTVRWDILKPLSIGGIPAALVGIFLAQWGRHTLSNATVHLWVQRTVGASVILAAVMILASAWLLRDREKKAPADPTNPAVRAKIIAIGVFVGLLVSLTSVGSGAVAFPLLAFVLPGVSFAELVGTDVAFGAIVVMVSLFAHWKMGNVSVNVAVPLVVGSLGGVYIGTRLCAILQQRWLRPALAAALVIAGTRLFI